MCIFELFGWVEAYLYHRSWNIGYTGFVPTFPKNMLFHDYEAVKTIKKTGFSTCGQNLKVTYSLENRTVHNKLRRLNWLRVIFCLELNWNHHLIDILEPNSWNLIESLLYNQLNRIRIYKKSKFIDFFDIFWLFRLNVTIFDLLIDIKFIF